MKFTELDYSIETGEAEMIGVDHVARGIGNAGDETGTAAKAEEKSPQTPEETKKSDSKGKGKAKDEVKEEREITFDSLLLPTQTQELLSTLTAKANAVRMLHSRLTLLLAYLREIEATRFSSIASSDPQKKLNHPLLRSLLSLTNRLPLLEPPSTAKNSLGSESLAELSDVHLIALLGSITTGIDVTREVGRKFGVVEAGRMNQRGGNAGSGHGDYGGYDSPGAEGEFGSYGAKGGFMGTLSSILNKSSGARNFRRL